MVKIDVLMSMLNDIKSHPTSMADPRRTRKQLILQVSEKEMRSLLDRLSWAKSKNMEYLSYNRFCLFIGEAVQERFYCKNVKASVKDPFTNAVSCYMI